MDQDQLAGAPDFSFLNAPLTSADRIFVRDGHFYAVGPDLQPNTADDRRVRFFGISFAFGANFPDPNNGDCVRVAKRLRRMGSTWCGCTTWTPSPTRSATRASSTAR